MERRKVKIENGKVKGKTFNFQLNSIRKRVNPSL